MNFENWFFDIPFYSLKLVIIAPFKTFRLQKVRAHLENVYIEVCNFEVGILCAYSNFRSALKAFFDGRYFS